MTIDLDEAVFDLLTREKRDGETYNEVLRRLLPLDGAVRITTDADSALVDRLRNGCPGCGGDRISDGHWLPHADTCQHESGPGDFDYMCIGCETGQGEHKPGCSGAG